MTPKLASEIQVLKDFSAKTKERGIKALDFNGYKPLIRRLGKDKAVEYPGDWMCSGEHPNGYTAFGFGCTPEEAYIDWTYDNIPF